MFGCGASNSVVSKETSRGNKQTSSMAEKILKIRFQKFTHTYINTFSKQFLNICTQFRLN